jgi:hypothetical protein
MGQSSNIGQLQSAQQQAQQQQLNTAVGNINSAFSGYTPAFYNNYASQFLNAAGPQVGQQARGAEQQLNYSLADKGLTDSSAGANLQNTLNQTVAQQETGVANQAQTAEQQLEQTVQGQKNTLIGEAESATNPGAVASQALSTAAQYQAPPVFAPLGQLFSNFENQQISGQYSSALTPYLTALSTQPLLYQGSGQGGGYGSGSGGGY